MTRRVCPSQPSCSAVAQDHRPAGDAGHRLAARRLHRSTIGSEQTAAAEAKVGFWSVADLMAMCCRSSATTSATIQHWINIGKNADESKLPKVFFVNWFLAAGDDEPLLWPASARTAGCSGVIEAHQGHRVGETTPIGVVPQVDDLDLTGSWTSTALTWKPRWRSTRRRVARRLPQMAEWFEFIGLPHRHQDEFDALKQRLS